MIETAVMIFTWVLAIGCVLTFFVGVRKLNVAREMTETARRVISDAANIPHEYTLITPFDRSNPEHLAKLSDAAMNMALRSLLLTLREESFAQIKAGASGDIGNREFGHLEAYGGVLAALDLAHGAYQKLNDAKRGENEPV